MYLTVEQRQKIDRLARAQGVTMAEVIRRALDEYLADQSDPAAVLTATFGADPQLAVPARDEWDRG